MATQVLANEVSASAVSANEVLAPLPEVTLSEPDYRAFCAALEASARGRAFLAEFARRNRHANTEVVLGALERLETMVREQAATSEADRIRQELRALLAALQAAKPAIDGSAAAIKAAKLGAMIAFVQHRIESIVANTQSPLPAEVAALVMPEEGPQETPHERSHLSVVPASEQPELPIPSPDAAAPAMALVIEPTPEAPAPQPVQNLPQPVVEVSAPAVASVAQPPPPSARPTAMTMPEVNLFDAAPTIQTPLIPAHAGIQESGLAPDNIGPGSPLAQRRADVSASTDAIVEASGIAQPVATAAAPAAPIATEPQPAVLIAALADDSETVDAIIETMIDLAQTETEAATPVEIEPAVAIEIAPPEIVAPIATAPAAEVAPPADTLPQFRLIPAEAGVVGAKLDLEDFRAEAAPEPAAQKTATPARGSADGFLADDPLALIMALSEAERIALFT